VAFTAGAAGVVFLPSVRPHELPASFLAGEAAFALGIVLAVAGTARRAWTFPPAVARRPGPWVRELAATSATSDVVLGGLAIAIAGALLHPLVLLGAAGELGVSAAGGPALPLLNVAATCLAGAPLLGFILRRRARFARSRGAS
jgi:hypothetical protein